MVKNKNKKIRKVPDRFLAFVSIIVGLVGIFGIIFSNSEIRSLITKGASNLEYRYSRYSSPTPASCIPNGKRTYKSDFSNCCSKKGFMMPGLVYYCSDGRCAPPRALVLDPKTCCGGTAYAPADTPMGRLGYRSCR